MCHSLVQMSDEETIDLTDDYLDDITDRTSLTNEKNKKQPSTSWKKSLCKAIVILIASIIFFAILIRSWTDYGTYITQHVFPPKVYSMSVQCQDNKVSFFNTPDCSWDTKPNTLLTCELDKPSRYIIHSSFHEYLVGQRWSDRLYLNYSKNITSCIDLTIWSI